jgi:hypothetical protein
LVNKEKEESDKWILGCEAALGEEAGMVERRYERLFKKSRQAGDWLEQAGS